VRPRLRRSAGHEPQPLVLSLPVAALAAAVLAAGLGLVVIGVPVLLGWAVAAHGTSTVAQALQAGGIGWLVAHRAPVGIAGGVIGVLPLGLLALPLWLTARTGAWAARAARVRGRGDAVLLVVGAALAYGLLAAVVAGAAPLGQTAVAPLAALVAASLVSLVGTGAGVVRAADLGAAVRASAPEGVWRVLRAGAAAALALVAASGVVAALALALHLHDALSVQRALAPGVVGGVLLMLLGMAYAPVAVIWAGSYVAGLGVAVGTGTTFTPLAVTDGPMPALPWLAALPEAAPRGGLALALLPVAAGAVGGLVLLRRLPATTTTVLVGELVGVGAVCGAIWAGLAALASGGMGPGRLVEAGPVWWAVGAVVAGEALVGVLLVVLGDTLRMRFQSGRKPA